MKVQEPLNNNDLGFSKDLAKENNPGNIHCANGQDLENDTECLDVTHFTKNHGPMKAQGRVKVSELDTPALLVREAILLRNIEDMAYFAENAGVNLRPHTKAHKLPPIARAQISAGAGGITVSKLGEAEVMIEDGITDILIAYELVGLAKMERLLHLLEKADLKVAVDSIEGARELDAASAGQNKKVKILLEINTGLNRCGVLPGEEALNLAQELVKLPHLQFLGIMTHAGHVYGAENWEKVEGIGQAEGEEMVKTAELLRAHGIEVPVVSVGSTPTAKIAGMVKGVTEVRPGNYVFYDAIQVGLGVAISDDCSLSVLATVISRPAPERVVIDAGSKVFALDQGAHGKSSVRGFGMVKGYDNIVVERLSEEHGILRVPVDCPLKIGDRIEIIPNHACTVINLFDEINLVRNDEVAEVWTIKGRGRVR